jgi:hypothetical protein
VKRTEYKAESSGYGANEVKQVVAVDALRNEVIERGLHDLFCIERCHCLVVLLR